MYTEPYAGEASGDLRVDRAYGELKRRLLAGEFRLNVRLGEERLATLVGVSRTPVREALHRLHAEGFVRRATDGGWEPFAPDVDVMRHLYEVRSGLELQALQIPARRGASHDLPTLLVLRDEWVAFKDDVTDPTDPAFVYLDESFHETLASAAGNPVLVGMLRQINERIRLVRTQDFLAEGRIDATIEEHLHLVDAVIAGELAEAERVFTLHLAASIAVVEERVLRALARMSTGGNS
ncbi:MAG: GntR family transcriptional regulator [Acidimicrobiales bacterium]|nr:GntR family transcriptional regulator [Acidimicrobiales bacterium]